MYCLLEKQHIISPVALINYAHCFKINSIDTIINIFLLYQVSFMEEFFEVAEYLFQYD